MTPAECAAVALELAGQAPELAEEILMLAHTWACVGGWCPASRRCVALAYPYFELPPRNPATYHQAWPYRLHSVSAVGPKWLRDMAESLEGMLESTGNSGVDIRVSASAPGEWTERGGWALIVYPPSYVSEAARLAEVYGLRGSLPVAFVEDDIPF